MNNNSQILSFPQRVGLFGGTFNPIHNGHTQVALDVAQRFNLDRIFFIPSALPPHKTRGTLAPAADRLEMVHLAVADHPVLEVSDLEIRRAGPSFTIDTLHHFKTLMPETGSLYFLLGLDAFMEIDTWKAFDQLFDEATFIVMARPRSGLDDLTLQQSVEIFTRHAISPHYTWSDKANRLVHPAKQPIHIAPVPQVDIAASRIRRMLRKGEAITTWVTPVVAHYIESKGLYR